MIPKYRVWITYGYTEEDLKNPDMTDEIKETGLGFMGIPDLIDFRNYEIRVKYDCDWYDSDRFTLMQSTGLKDKNGKEIYEGDVLKGRFMFTDVDGESSIHTSVGVVRWAENSGRWVVDGEVFRGEDLKDWNVGELCIIGNIYENPELMEKNQPSERELKTTEE